MTFYNNDVFIVYDVVYLHTQSGCSQNCARLGNHCHHPKNCFYYLQDYEVEDLHNSLEVQYMFMSMIHTHILLYIIYHKLYIYYIFYIYSCIYYHLGS